MTREYFLELTAEKSEIFGRTFALSSKEGMDSKKFVEAVMTEESMSDLVNVDEDQRWCDEYMLLNRLEDKREKPFEKGDTTDQYVMWFLGYLYKYWMRLYNLDAKTVYKILPFDRYLVMYNYYHTQDWDKVIYDATESYKEGNYIV